MNIDDKTTMTEISSKALRLSSGQALRFALIAAIISGFAVFINKFGVKLWDDSTAYTTAKNIVAAVFLTCLIMMPGRFAELKTLSKKLWTKLALVGLIGGSIPFLLFFKSLTLIPASEAAFIHKTLHESASYRYSRFMRRRSQIPCTGCEYYRLAAYIQRYACSRDAGYTSFRKKGEMG